MGRFKLCAIGVVALLLGACASVRPLPPAPVQGYHPSAARARRPVAPPPQARAPYIAPGLRGTDKPYQVNGVWYVPADQPDYDATGIASWYGPGFQGKATATGEIFDTYGISAAHTTLPLPCIVEVTNLENGRSLQVRVNDRGPFVEGRIIDLSHAAAEALGFVQKGTARVRVRFVRRAPEGLDAPVQIARSAPKPWSPPPYEVRRSELLDAAYVPAAYAAPGSAEVDPMSWVEGAPSAGPPVRPAVRPPVQSLATPRGFAVQAGAFADPEQARRAAARLNTLGAARVAPSDGGWRVLVGPWLDRASAGEAQARIAAAGFPDARVRTF